MENKIHIMDHPLIQHKVSLLRDKNTGSKDFRELVMEISMLICYEATRDLPLKEIEVDTPVAVTKTSVISGRKLAFVPILRAGLGMADGAIKLIPSVKIGHIGLYRDSKTLKPKFYYMKLPVDMAKREAIVLDPMLATGGSANYAISEIKKHTKMGIKFMCIIASPEGIDALMREHPDIEIYCAAVDEKLNNHGYIVPGLGDAGDRIFGTQ